MSDKGDATRFERIDAEQDPSYFVRFLDARKSIPQEALIKGQIIKWLQPLEGKRALDAGCGTGDDSRAIAGLVGAKGQAFEDAMEKTSTKHAPWFVIPSNHKWSRNLAISTIVANTLEDVDLKLPPTQVDLADIRRKYHAAAVEEGQQGNKPPKVPGKK